MKSTVDLSKLPKLVNKATQVAKKVFETRLAFRINFKSRRKVG